VISFIRGEVWKVAIDHLVIDCSPFGLKILCPPSTALGFRVGDHIQLHTSLIVREDSWTLYGFETEEEVALFDMVQTVSGIGPRIALGVLSTLTPDSLRQAIATDDLATLKKISGIGAKGASRMVLELKDKVGAMGYPGTPASAPSSQSWRQSVGNALASLGWSTREADQAMDRVTENLPELLDSDQPDISVLLKESLRSLDRT
jgi:holliday junction DNA helicase RuvA